MKNADEGGMRAGGRVYGRERETRTLAMMWMCCTATHAMHFSIQSTSARATGGHGLLERGGGGEG
jgi:hypothetical protein